MSDTLLLFAVLGTAYIGFALLALSQRRYWRQIFSAGAPIALPLLFLRGLGSLALTASLAVSLLRDGADYGALLWVTALSLSAMAVALTLAWRPSWLRPLASCAARTGCPRETTPR